MRLVVRAVRRCAVVVEDKQAAITGHVHPFLSAGGEEDAADEGLVGHAFEVERLPRAVGRAHHDAILRAAVGHPEVLVFVEPDADGTYITLGILRIRQSRSQWRVGVVIEADEGVVFDLDHALAEGRYEAVRRVVRVDGHTHIVLHPEASGARHGLLVEVRPFLIHAAHQRASAIAACGVRVRSTDHPEPSAVDDHKVVFIALRPLDLESRDGFFVLSLGPSAQAHQPVASRSHPETAVLGERRDPIDGTRRHRLTRTLKRGEDVHRFRGVSHQPIADHREPAQVRLLAERFDRAVRIAIEESTARGHEAESIAEGTEADDLLIVKVEAVQRDTFPVADVHQVGCRGRGEQSAVRRRVDRSGE